MHAKVGGRCRLLHPRELREMPPDGTWTSAQSFPYWLLSWFLSTTHGVARRTVFSFLDLFRFLLSLLLNGELEVHLACKYWQKIAKFGTPDMQHKKWLRSARYEQHGFHAFLNKKEARKVFRNVVQWFFFLAIWRAVPPIQIFRDRGVGIVYWNYGCRRRTHKSAGRHK